MARSLSLDHVEFRGMRREVSQVLRKAIFDGTYEPGQQIYEAELAKKLNLSRGPIREALLQLEKESLVHSVFNKGWFVIELSTEQLAEILSLRAVLEILALQRARENAKRAEIKRLHKIQDTMIESFEKERYDDTIQADFQFHQEVWHCAHHPVLQEVLVKLTTPYFVFFTLARMRKGLDLHAFGESLRNHGLFLDFIEGKADLTAEACIRRHFEVVRLQDWDVLLNLGRGRRKA